MFDPLNVVRRFDAKPRQIADPTDKKPALLNSGWHNGVV